MKIYRTSDRLQLKIEDIVFYVSPLDYATKMSIQDLGLKAAKGSMESAMEMFSLVLKRSVKGVKGIENQDGSAYELEKDENGNLTDECVNDLLNSSCGERLTIAAGRLLRGVPDESELRDDKGNVIEGVSFLSGNGESLSSKSKKKAVKKK